jgi:hypothetical protein
MLHGEDTDPLAAADPADRISHVQPGPLLPHDDRPDIQPGRLLDDRVDGIANEEVDPLVLQDLRRRRRRS